MRKSLIFCSALFLFFGLFAGCASTENKDNNNEKAPLIQTSEKDTSALAPTFLSEENIKTLIKYNLEILAKNDPDKILSEIGSLNHKLFDEIIALGEEALPHLEMLTDRSNIDVSWFPDVEIEHRIWAVHAIYAIKPETYDLFFPSFDGNYTARITVDSFASFFNHGCSYNGIQIIENSSNAIVYTTEMNKAAILGGVFTPFVNWSADSGFAVIDCSGLRSASVMAIDLQAKTDMFLPGFDEVVKYVFSEKGFGLTLLDSRCSFSFEGWETEHSVIIRFSLLAATENQTVSGWYLYDLVQNEMLEIEA